MSEHQWKQYLPRFPAVAAMTALMADRILILKGCARRSGRPAPFAGLEPEHADRSSFLLLPAVFADRWSAGLLGLFYGQVGQAEKV